MTDRDLDYLHRYEMYLARKELDRKARQGKVKLFVLAGVCLGIIFGAAVWGMLA